MAEKETFTYFKSITLEMLEFLIFSLIIYFQNAL